MTGGRLVWQRSGFDLTNEHGRATCGEVGQVGNGRLSFGRAHHALHVRLVVEPELEDAVKRRRAAVWCTDDFRFFDAPQTWNLHHQRHVLRCVVLLEGGRIGGRPVKNGHFDQLMAPQTDSAAV
jgi:hypothetical protein